MKEDGGGYIAAMLFGIFIGTSIALFFWGQDEREWKSEAVNRGAAEYDSKTGEWKWIEKEVGR